MIAAESQSAKLGLWLFLAADSMFFLGLIGAYMVLRSGQPAIFATGTVALRSQAVTDAALLIWSSLMMFVASGAAKHAPHDYLMTALAETLLFACLFLIFTVKDIQLPSLPMDAFHACYFTIMAIYDLHIVGATIAILILLAQAVRGKILPAQTQLVAIYWHFIVLLWILLFPILFLTGTR